MDVVRVEVKNYEAKHFSKQPQSWTETKWEPQDGKHFADGKHFRKGSVPPQKDPVYNHRHLKQE